MAPRVLLLGGHGKVSLLLTPLLLAKHYNVTSVIRNAAQSDDIVLAGKGQPGKVDVLVKSLEDVKSDQDAQKILDEVRPDYVVWSAGAGGKGGPTRTYAIDRDAAKHFIASSISTPNIKKFLLVSAINSRRNRPAWWSDEDWATAQKMRDQILVDYSKAKLEADEYLTVLAKKRLEAGDAAFQSIILRPGGLTDEPATGKVSLGRTHVNGGVTRADVAAVAAALLERDDTRGWFDLLNGDEPLEEAVKRVVREKIDSIEGEDVEAMAKRFS